MPSERNPVSETIWTSENYVVPMAEVSHIEKQTQPAGAIVLVYKHSRWVPSQYEPNTYLLPDQAESFMRAWLYYRHELDGPFKEQPNDR